MSISGADTNELSVTANALIKVSSAISTLTVTNNSNASTSQDVNITRLNKTSTVTINGLVTDEAIINAKIDISVGDENTGQLSFDSHYDLPTAQGTDYEKFFNFLRWEKRILGE